MGPWDGLLLAKHHIYIYIYMVEYVDLGDLKQQKYVDLEIWSSKDM